MIIAKGKMRLADGPYGFHWNDKVGFDRGDRSRKLSGFATLREVNFGQT
jgi:hypothetical protein